MTRLKGLALAGAALAAFALSGCATTSGAELAVSTVQVPQPVADPVGVPHGRLERIAQHKSAYVQPRDVTVWLPATYDGRRRFPVIYAMDGQNLFQPGFAYGGEEWGLDEAMSALIASGATRGAIIVGVHNTNLRSREYLPQKVVGQLSAADRARTESVHGGPALADAYLRYLVTELKPLIDRTYRTRPGRADTSIMGSSMGGLISLYALGEYPDVFGQAAAVSIHWPLARPEQDLRIDPTTMTAAFTKWIDASKMTPGRNRLYADQGTGFLDVTYTDYARLMERAFAARGWKQDARPDQSAFDSRVFPGADHNEKAWRARADIPLRFLLRAPETSQR